MWELLLLADGSYSIRLRGQELGVVKAPALELHGFCEQCGELMFVHTKADAAPWAQALEHVLNHPRSSS